MLVTVSNYLLEPQVIECWETNWRDWNNVIRRKSLITIFPRKLRFDPLQMVNQRQISTSQVEIRNVTRRRRRKGEREARDWESNKRTYRNLLEILAAEFFFEKFSEVLFTDGIFQEFLETESPSPHSFRLNFLPANDTVHFIFNYTWRHIYFQPSGHCARYH